MSDNNNDGIRFLFQGSFEEPGLMLSFRQEILLKGMLMSYSHEFSEQQVWVPVYVCWINGESRMFLFSWKLRNFLPHPSLLLHLLN